MIGFHAIPRDRIERVLMSHTDIVREYTVLGMTCEHCVLSVTEEVSEVAGVQNVDVELASGRLVVAGDVSEHAVRDAVAEAGYEVAS
jgi:copper chaperone CopZ